MKAVQIMTWYSCCYDNKRTLKISVEVAFDYLDNTLLFSFHRIYNYCRLNLISRRCCRLDQFFFHYIIFLFIYRFFSLFFFNICIFFHSPPSIMVAYIIELISLQTLMSVLRIPTTAVWTMLLAQIQRDCSTAHVILDSAGMDTTVQVWEFFKVWLLSRFSK